MRLRTKLAQIPKTIMLLFLWGGKGISGKTSWEWLELLIVPLFLAGGAFYLENQVEEKQVRIADKRAKQEALDKYLEKMQGLLLDRNLRSASEGSEVRSVARAITVTTMRKLDSEHNALLIGFLEESSLIQKQEKTSTIALLSSLDLSNMDLRSAVLNNTDLNGVSLEGADLSGADLSRADLSDAYLLKANLRGADLGEANLRDTNLSNVDLRGADLSRTDLRDAGLIDADLRNANLSGADLSGTFLSGADLNDTILFDATLFAPDIQEDAIVNSRICRTKLPSDYKTDPNRNCYKLILPDAPNVD